MEEVWRRFEPARSSRKERRCTQRCNTQPVFILWSEEWKDCEELKPTSKEKWTFVNTKVEEKRHRMEWCAAASNFRCMGM